MNVVEFAVRDVYEAWNVAAQIEQYSHRHRCSGRAEVRPREHRHAKIDRRIVTRTDGVGELQSQAITGVEPLRLGGQSLRERRIDPPVAGFIGIRKGRPADRFGKTSVIQCGRLRRDLHLDIAQALPIGQSGEGLDPAWFDT